MQLSHRCPSVNVLFEPSLAILYRSLDAGHELRILLDNVGNILKDNIYAGARVPKQQIPQYYIVNYGVHVIYRLRINKCRVIYTLDPVSGGTNTVVLECFTDHKSYAKRFGYKTQFYLILTAESNSFFSFGLSIATQIIVLLLNRILLDASKYSRTLLNV